MNRIREKSERYVTLPALRDLRAPGTKAPEFTGVRPKEVKALGPPTIEVREHRIPSFLLVRS